jgi:hypothetical protein
LFGFEKTLNKDSCNLLDPIFERNLNDEEFASFDFDFNYFINPITVGLRLKTKNIIYHSKDYTRVGRRRCNYAVQFKGSNTVNYGLINYFFVLN